MLNLQLDVCTLAYWPLFCTLQANQFLVTSLRWFICNARDSFDDSVPVYTHFKTPVYEAAFFR